MTATKLPLGKMQIESGKSTIAVELQRKILYFLRVVENEIFGLEIGVGCLFRVIIHCVVQGDGINFGVIVLQIFKLTFCPAFTSVGKNNFNPTGIGMANVFIFIANLNAAHFVAFA